jgi:hypothetical protein
LYVQEIFGEVVAQRSEVSVNVVCVFGVENQVMTAVFGVGCEVHGDFLDS